MVQPFQIRQTSMQSHQPEMLGRQLSTCALHTSPMSKPSLAARPSHLHERESQLYQNDNKSLSKYEGNSSLDDSHGSVSTNNSHDTSVPSINPSQFGAKVPSWIPREERRYWMDNTSTPLSAALSETQENEISHLQQFDEGLRSQSPFRKLFPTNWRKLRIFRMSSHRKEDDNTRPPPQGCSSARRSFKAYTNRKGIWGSKRETEDRMSVNRNAYNAMFQSHTPTVLRPNSFNEQERFEVRYDSHVLGDEISFATLGKDCRVEKQQ